ncbi:GNAT family N-acetyltransferase [Arthrobacter sp. MSA 4-2]|uniref:GNAT family N-acetyltransferase n=1 Tax=Arthrobacter sp. MSA 4-2 TaxID=2794349 RepID=UPI0018E7F5FC|nr:GNAT family N-acetyltransferase [Arthrobacter sp. MSA 4-2]MBJ2121390.1 GNAT family N-acetyltransferase [Arthrobacter sp. MSA 4-2]
MVTIAQVQRLHTAWFAALATATGGKTFSTHGCTWAWLPARSQLLLLFPEEVSLAGIRPGLAEGSRLGAKTVGVWMNGAVRSSALSSLGFSPGWQPWWMAAPVGVPAAYEDGAAELSTEVPEYLGPLARELRVVRSQPRQAWHAETRVGGNVVGAAYAFYPSGVPGLRGLGGIFSLEVLPEYRHRGLGTALLSRAAKAAAASGARHLAVNAAPSGSEFFAARGFDLVGRGKTLWMAL